MLSRIKYTYIFMSCESEVISMIINEDAGPMSFSARDHEKLLRMNIGALADYIDMSELYNFIRRFYVR